MKKTKPFKTETKTVKINKTYVKIDGKKFEFYDLYNLVESLEDTSYGFNHVVIHDKDLEDALVKLKVFSKTARGSGVRGPGFDAFRDRIEKTYHKLMEREST